MQSRGLCQNRGGSVSETRGLSVKTVTTLCQNREGSLSEPRGSSVGAAGRLSVRTEGGSLREPQQGPVLEPQGALCEKLGVLLLKPSLLFSVRIAVRLSVTTGDLCQIFFAVWGVSKTESTTKTRPTGQRIARRSCPHAHPEKK